MAKSALDQIRALDDQKAKLIAAAKSEARRKLEKALKELNELGFDYRIVLNGRGGEPRRKKARKGRKRGMRSADTACKICGFRTLPPHDARTHRGQKKKAPFMNKDLAERKMRRA